jgi:integrase
VTAATARAIGTAGDVLGDYERFVAGLDVNPSQRWQRRRAARAFLARHCDLEVWMARPTAARLADLHRLKAWPLLSWLFVEGHLRPDLELLLAKPGGVDLGVWWSDAHPDDVRLAHEIAERLGWSPNWARQVIHHSAPVLCLWRGKTLSKLTDDDFDVAARAAEQANVRPSTSARFAGRCLALRQLCFQAGIVDQPPPDSKPPALSPAEHAATIAQPEIRRDVVRYAEIIATTLRPATAQMRIKAIRVLAGWLADHHPEVTRLDQLDRTRHIEPFLAWSRTRPHRGANGRGKTVGLTVFHHDIIDLRVFFEDIAEWSWPTASQQRLLFLSDLPRLPEPMPRALTPDTDRALMAAVAGLEDPFARCGLTVLRATGLRVGELLDLELDCIVDFGAHGTWLRVPVGKLGTERMVPLDPKPLALLDAWITNRGPQRSLPHPRHSQPADFVFVERGRRLGAHRLRTGLRAAVAAAGLTDRAGNPLRVTLHQLRHTFGTSLVNAGVSLPALMALLGHVTPEMTLRYARLASPTIRDAYETAMTKLHGRRSIFTIPAGATRAVPSKVDWLHTEMLKTRVAHGFCSRHPAAGACPYANICEQCDNFVADPNRADILADQRDDIRALRDDAEQRGWADEAARHQRVADALDTHLQQLERAPARTRVVDPSPKAG